jgi:hypothetical protein
MRSILRNVTHGLLLLSALAALPASPGRTVLCVAPDGHLAIESGEGRCADFPSLPTGTLGNAGLGTEPDGCGDCVDVPMGQQVLSTVHRASSARVSEGIASAPMVVHARFALPALAPGLETAPAGAPPHPSFPPSRTTILRN